ncbi:MAG TPA: 4-hydroxy-3-methylbut-2-enyl diphosphate reductase [Dehalococcoidia bacterium]|nr:4-hydroxy-3-methylbut-2-enyl diphosphate reductase [Dehalococcoidia bacterium]
MEIVRARDMGFCFGVRRAVNLMEKAAQEGPINSLGSIVHNPQVVDRLQERGVMSVKSFDDVTEGRVAITAHGVGPAIYQEAGDRGLPVVDTTCTIVHRAQAAAKKLADEGFAVIIYGDPDHKEVRGILAWAGDYCIATTDWDEVTPLLRLRRRIGLLAQTTKHTDHFQAFCKRVIDYCLHRAIEIRVVNTLCHVTTKQQQAVVDLAPTVDLMIVVGGKSSANTRQLRELAESLGTPAHHIETPDEIDPAWLVSRDRVGVTAGASTPDWIIDAVVERLEQLAASRV